MQRRLLVFRGFLLILLFLFSIPGQAKPAMDTIVSIKRLQQSAEQAIEKQRYEDALFMLNRANSLASSKKYLHFKPEIELSYANLYLNIKYLAKAETIVSKSLEDQTFTGRKLAKTYTLYSRIKLEKKDPYGAEFYIDKADSVYKSIKETDFNHIIFLNKGRAALEKDDPETAVDFFKEAITASRPAGDQNTEAKAYLYLADAYSKTTEFQKNPDAAKSALDALTFATAIAEHNNFSGILAEANRIRFQISLEQGKSEAAEKYLQLYQQQTDSIKQSQLNTILTSLQTESLLDRIYVIQDQSEPVRSEKSQLFGKLTGWLSVALIIILSLLTLSLYKNNNLRAKANALLQEKNTELQKAKETVEKASKAKALFLSTITHELRTPMYTVTGLTHLLLEEDPKPEQREHLNSLKFSGEYLLSLINNILDLNKLEAKKVELEKRAFNLKKRVKGVIISMKDAADGKKNELHLEYDDAIPEEILGDSLRITQILINLISNSIKFTEEESIWVRIRQIKKDDRTVDIHFEVEDSGDGISESQQKIIFDSFSQGSIQINRKYGGTGLGLSIVKNLIELMGSSIYLESEVGKGSRFWFTLTYDYNKEVQKEDIKEIDVKDIEEIPEKNLLKNRSILIVEDNKINQMITKKILDKRGMKCMVTDNGSDAVEMVRNQNFDIVLMDIHMPGISGVEATKKIREFDKKTPIIALTAVTIDENLEEFFSSGFNEFIPKPFKAEDFFEKISKLLGDQNEKVNV